MEDTRLPKCMMFGELVGAREKGGSCVFPGRLQSFRHQRQPVDDFSSGRGEVLAQDGGTRGGTFHGEMDRCRESQGWTTACSSICPNVTRRANWWGARVAWGARKKGGWRVFPGRLQSFRHQRRPVDDFSSGRGKLLAQDGGTRGGTFHGEMDRCRESHGWTTACSSICPNVTRRAKERIAQSKRARAGSLAIVDKLKAARTLYPPGIWFADIDVMSFSGVTLFVLYVSFSRLFVFTEEAAALRSIVFRSSICMRSDSHTQLPNNTLCVLFCFFCFFGRMSRFFSVHSCIIIYGRFFFLLFKAKSERT